MTCQKIEYEPFKKYPLVKGVFLGGCIAAMPGDPPSSYRAHAHISGEHDGWICIRGKNLPNQNLMLHELSHILAKEGHTQKWAKILLSLGGKIHSRYRKLKGVAKAIK